MRDKNWKKRFAEEAQTNAVVAATVYGLAGAVVGLSWAAANSTPERRQKIKEEQAKYRRERAQRDHESRQSELRHRLRESYFKEGPGKDLLAQRGHIILPAGPDFPDATIASVAAGMGGTGFKASSASGRVALMASYNAYDARGSFRLDRRDGSFRTGEASFSIQGLVIYPDDDLEAWIDDAKLMARLIATLGPHCRQVELRRPDYQEIRRAIWREYVQANPHIAAAIGHD